MSASGNGRPVGEGESRTTHMHAGEESDNGVVLMKQPNNSGQAPRGQPEAEDVEGSPLTKENVCCAAHRPHSEADRGVTEANERASEGCYAAIPDATIQGRSRMR